MADEQKYIVLSTFQKSNLKKVPIDPKIDDPFYRYTVRQLTVISLGLGYKGRLDTLNLVDFSHDLHVPPEWILMWIKTMCNMRIDLKNQHIYTRDAKRDLDKINKSLIKFICVLVLCPKCNLPELSYYVDTSTLNRTFKMRCDSCGHFGGPQRGTVDKSMKTYLIKSTSSNYPNNIV